MHAGGGRHGTCGALHNACATIGVTRRAGLPMRVVTRLLWLHERFTDVAAAQRTRDGHVVVLLATAARAADAVTKAAAYRTESH